MTENLQNTEPTQSSKEARMFAGSIFGFLALASATLGIYGLIELGSPEPANGLIKLAFSVALGFAANNLWQGFGDQPHTENPQE